MATGTASEALIAPREGVLDRLSARLRGDQLDEALARGAPTEAAAALALRARRLTTLASRRVIADGFRRVLRDNGRALPSSSVRVLPCRARVLVATGELTRLADTLATPGPVAARGVAQARILLTDGSGPLYNPNSKVDLRSRAASAADNLRLDG